MSELFTEKKTLVQYRKRKLKKDYNFIPEPNGNGTKGTIEYNGERIPIELPNTGNKHSKPVGKSNPSRVRLTNQALNTRHSTDKDFILGHEIGHQYIKNERKYNWENDDRENLESQIKRRIKNLNREHGRNPDEYLSDMFSAYHTKDGFRNGRKAITSSGKKIQGVSDEAYARRKFLKDYSYKPETDYIKNMK